MTGSDGQTLIDRSDSRRSIARQCQPLKYPSTPVSDDDLAKMRRPDEQYLGKSSVVRG
jgi:hypothetical protein